MYRTGTPPERKLSVAISPARGPPQTDLLAVDPPSPWDQANQRNHATPGRDPFDQSLPGDDRTWSA